MRTQQVYRRIAELLSAIRICEQNGNGEWLERHRARLDMLMNTAPSGSGWDLGTGLIDDECRDNRLVFRGSFHHLNEGYYDGWTDHTIVVRAHLVFGIDLKVTGRDRNDIKEYLSEMFHGWLTEEITEDADGVWLSRFRPVAST